MNGLWTRRGVLLAGVCAGMASSPGAWAFDRAKEGERYRVWLERFKRDLQVLSAKVSRQEPLSLDHIHQYCAGSLVPHSRAAKNFLDWLNHSRKKGDATVSGEIVFVGPLTIVMRLLAASIPAGNGGLFDEPKDSGYADRTLSVWYMHIHGGEHLQRYFDNPKAFAPYHLPAEGQLERAAYPFLLFEDQPT